MTVPRDASRQLCLIDHEQFCKVSSVDLLQREDAEDDRLTRWSQVSCRVNRRRTRYKRSLGSCWRQVARSACVVREYSEEQLPSLR